MIDLTVKTLDSRNHSFSVPDDITVKQFKERIADSVNVPADSQRLIYCGRVLQDDKNLSEYDVNGKVIHLVQRAPPMPHSGGSEGGGTPRSNSQPYSRVTGGNYRRRLFERRNFQDRLDGNAMYLGAMAFPADLMESQGLTMPQPRQCLSQSRLAVAREMLHRASNTLNHLEHPNSTQDSPTDNTSDTNDNNNGEDALPGSIAVAAQVATAAAIAAAVSAAQGTSVPSQLRMDGNQTGEEEMRGDDLASGPETSSAANSSREQSQNQQQASSGTENTSQNESGNGNANGGRSRRTIAMAEMLDTLAVVNRRLQPYLEQFHQTMREDPVLESPEETQRMFTQVSEVMHFLSHAYHALSDIMCDFSQPPPRFLRCRPVLIQHSAVVQTGIPIQAQFNLTPLNQNQTSSQSQQQQSNGQANRDMSAANNDGAANEGAAASAEASTNNASTEQTVDARLNNAIGGATAATGTSTASSGGPPNNEDRTNRTRPAQGRAGVRGTREFSGPNFEFFMDVAPASITIDSLEATVVTNANSNNPSEINLMGGLPWGSHPPAEIIQNLMQAITGQMMDGAANRQQTGANPSAGNANNSSTTQPTPTAQQPQNASSASANSQARGNTATHPTTSTQTRSTSRPHVHLTPAAVQGTFDPFLPCNSHHIRSSRRRNSQQQQQQQNQASTQQQSQQSQQSTAQQMSQNAHQQAASQQTGTTQPSQSNNSSQSSRRVHPVPPMPSDRNHPNSNIDAAMNNFVTVVMNMANRNIGRWNVGPRTNSTATNTPGSGSARTEGDNVTVTTQTPPLQVLSNAFLATNVGGNSGPTIQQLPLPPGFPFAVLNHVISALGGSSPQIPSSSSSLSEFLQALPDFSYTPGESIFMDLFMALAQSLTFVDIVNLGFGNPDGLIRARSRLCDFLQQRLLLNEPFSEAASVRATGIINQDFCSLLENVISDPENRLREDIDLISSINQFNLRHLPRIMVTILEEPDESFHHVLFRQCHEYINYFFAIMQYCCLDGVQGMENIIRGFVRQMTAGVPEQLQAWTVTSSVVNFRHYLSSRTSQTNLSNIYQFIVYRAQPPSNQSQQTATTVTPIEQSQPQRQTPNRQDHAVEPMEVEAPSRCVRNTEETPVLTGAAAEINSEPMPDVLLGSEDWHGALPSDWVPIIARDSQRQRRQNSQPPFSDAYLSGMPSKRRKLITSAKPQGNISHVISENMRAAVSAAGVSAPDIEVGVVAQGAGTDPTLRLAYRDQIRASVRQNLQSHPDYTPDKYPNAAKYFDTK